MALAVFSSRFWSSRVPFGHDPPFLRLSCHSSDPSSCFVKHWTVQSSPKPIGASQVQHLQVARMHTSRALSYATQSHNQRRNKYPKASSRKEGIQAPSRRRLAEGPAVSGKYRSSDKPSFCPPLKRPSERPSPARGKSSFPQTSSVASPKSRDSWSSSRTSGSSQKYSPKKNDAVKAAQERRLPSSVAPREPARASAPRAFERGESTAPRFSTATESASWSAFPSPPLLPAFVSSLHSMLGTKIRPTWIQQAAVQWFFPSSKESTNSVRKSGTTEGGHRRSWRQVLLASETGSGKTFAYLLPVLQNLKVSELERGDGLDASAGSLSNVISVAEEAKTLILQRQPSESVTSGDEASETRQVIDRDTPRKMVHPRALVMAPTHELVRQLSASAKSLVHNAKLRVVCTSRANLRTRASDVGSTADYVDGQVAGLAGKGEGENGDSNTLDIRSPGSALPGWLGSGRSVDVVVGTPNKLLEMIRGRGWHRIDGTTAREPDRKRRPVHEEENDAAHKGSGITVGEPEMGLDKVEWLVIDEADVLFDPDFQDTTLAMLSSIADARTHLKPVHRIDASIPATAIPGLPSPSVDTYPFHLILTTATIPPYLLSYLETHHPSMARLVSPYLHRLPPSMETEYVGWSNSGGDRAKWGDVERHVRKIWAEDARVRLARGGGDVRAPETRTRILIFCNKSTKVEALGEFLSEKGIPNVALAGESEARRWGSNKHLNGFLRVQHSDSAPKDNVEKKSRGPSDDSPHVLITTSLLSRGLDFAPTVSHVFILDEPRNTIDFMHRAGRTARAGSWGRVVVFGKAKGRGSKSMGEIRKRVEEMRVKGKEKVKAELRMRT